MEVNESVLIVKDAVDVVKANVSSDKIYIITKQADPMIEYVQLGLLIAILIVGLYVLWEIKKNQRD